MMHLDSFCNFELKSPYFSKFSFSNKKTQAKKTKASSVILPYKIENLKKYIYCCSGTPNCISTDENKGTHFNLPKEKSGEIQEKNSEEFKLPTFEIKNFRPVGKILSIGREDLETVSKSPLKIRKEMLRDNEYVGQIESKYLATVTNNILLLWDQHALHERIRLEMLQEQYLTKCVGQNAVISSPVPGKLKLYIPTTDLDIVRSSDKELQSFGLKISGDLITEIPACFLQLDPQRCEDLTRKLVKEFVMFVKSGEPCPCVPATVHNLLCSLACRGAIMFGQEVNEATAKQLIRQINSCQAPFQCAHGRPSLAPLVRIDNV